MSTSGFLYRDILKYILPISLFYILFSPYFVLPKETKLDFNTITMLVLATSMILGLLVENFSNYPFLIFKCFRQNKEIQNWMSQNCQFRKLFYYIDKDERDYLYLTAAYITFCINSGFILILYSFFIVYHMFHESVGCKDFMTHQTQFHFGTYIYSLPILVIIFILIILIKNFIITESKFLFYPNSQYEYFAEKKQKELKEYIFFKKIYGRVYNTETKEFEKNIKIDVYANGNLIQSTNTNDLGCWSIPLADSFKQMKITIKTPNNNTQPKIMEIDLDKFEKPYFENTITPYAPI